MSSLRDELMGHSNTLSNRLLLSESAEDLHHILQSYCSLWTQVTGLPPVCSYMAIELAIACNLAITAVRAWLSSKRHASMSDQDLGDIKLVHHTMESRMKECVHSGHDYQVGNECATLNKPIISSCIHKLEVIQQLMNHLSTFNTDGSSSIFQDFLLLKNSRSVFPSIDDIYWKALRFYEKEEIQECIDYLKGSDQLCREDTSPLKLLLGNCHYKLGKYHSAVYYYSQCTEGDPQCSLLAMGNCCAAYEALGNIDAEIEMRQLLIESLTTDDSGDNGGLQNIRVYTHEREGLSLSNSAHQDGGLLVAQYELGRRALQCGRSSIAETAFKAVIETDHELYPSSIPPPSVTYLMLYMSSPPSSRLTMLHQLYTTLTTTSDTTTTSVTLSQADKSSKCLLLSQVLWLMADSHMMEDRPVDARDSLISCLSFINHFTSKSDQDNDSLQEFKDMIVHNLSITIYQIRQQQRNQL